MKIIRYSTVAFFFFLVVIGCSSPVPVGKRTDQQILSENKVKKMTEYSTEYHLGMPDPEHKQTVKYFNEKGFLTNDTVFTETGRVDYFSMLKYDGKNKLIQLDMDSLHGGFICKEIRRYDSINRTMQITHWEIENGPYLVSHILYTDSLGRQLKQDWFWPTGARAAETYKYDGMKLTEDYEDDYFGHMSFKWNYNYDAAGNQVEAIEYYPDGSITDKILSEYDKRNQLIKLSHYLRDNLSYMATFEYDDNHLLVIKTEYTSPGRISKKYRYVYESY